MEALGAVYTIPDPEESRTQHWNELVEAVRHLPVTDPQVMALSLTLRRMRRVTHHDGTLCHEPHCRTCAAEITAGHCGSEHELVEMYYRHLDEVQATLRSMRQRARRAPGAAAA